MFVVEDTLEDIIFDEEDKKSKDKPYNAWIKVKSIIENNELENYYILKQLFEFAYNLN